MDWGASMFIKVFLAMLAVAAIGPACTNMQSPQPQDRQTAYLAAIEAAAVPGPNAVARLNPIKGKQATVVSWAAPYYKPGKTKLEFGALWVTASPQVKNICQSLPNGSDQARLEELLGLPPGGGKDRSFVVMTVNTADLFRPCPDTRIDQATCPVDLPKVPPPGVDPAQYQKDLDFLLNQMLTSYQRDGGYPFTRLGYTYDWSPQATSPVGPSEYVIRKGSEINVLKIISNQDYCAKPTG